MPSPNYCTFCRFSCKEPYHVQHLELKTIEDKWGGVAPSEHENVPIDASRTQATSLTLWIKQRR